MTVKRKPILAMKCEKYKCPGLFDPRKWPNRRPMMNNNKNKRRILVAVTGHHPLPTLLSAKLLQNSRMWTLLWMIPNKQMLPRYVFDHFTTHHQHEYPGPGPMDSAKHFP